MCELTVGQPVGFSVGSEPADRQMSRFFHDVTQLTRQCELTFSLHPTGLHKHDLPTERSPGQAHSHAGQGEALRDLSACTHNNICQRVSEEDFIIITSSAVPVEKPGPAYTDESKRGEGELRGERWRN